MILLYHHVCPSHEIPVACSQLEGWQYNIQPKAFEKQLCALETREFQFVSLDQYVKAMNAGERSFGSMATVTFDDGWKDNYEYAFPILKRRNIPATFFIVSGDMPGVSWERRMTFSQLRQMRKAGMTIGAHSRTHHNLAQPTGDSLAAEIHGSKRDLETEFGEPVDYLAYPGGRFNREVVEVTRRAGFRAACSAINWGRNTDRSRFWLYRDVLPDTLRTLPDVLRLNSFTRFILGSRARRRVKRMLS